jgi:hypothetical protein
MIEAHRHLIRAEAGRIRVLRLVADGGRIYPLRYHARRGPGMCQVCGCTRQYACPGGCAWLDHRRDICTKCAWRIMR